jgi:hypothetical protein
MDQKAVIDMAIQAGVIDSADINSVHIPQGYIDDLAEFAYLVQQVERAEIIKAIELYHANPFAGMSKHTPGPWALRRDPSHFDSLTEITGGICGNTKPFRSTLEVSIGGDTDIHTLEANARLIAAAPDLLEALEVIVATEHERHGYNPFWTDQAHAAIAKAKGGV